MVDLDKEMMDFESQVATIEIESLRSKNKELEDKVKFAEIKINQLTKESKLEINKEPLNIRDVEGKVDPMIPNDKEMMDFENQVATMTIESLLSKKKQLEDKVKIAEIKIENCPSSPEYIPVTENLEDIEKSPEYIPVTKSRSPSPVRGPKIVFERSRSRSLSRPLSRSTRDRSRTRERSRTRDLSRTRVQEDLSRTRDFSRTRNKSRKKSKKSRRSRTRSTSRPRSKKSKRSRSASRSRSR